MTEAERRALIVEGLRHVVQKREQLISQALHAPDDVRKRDSRVWREGHDLANAAEQHASRILCAVEAFRAADFELTMAKGTPPPVKPAAPEGEETQHG